MQGSKLTSSTGFAFWMSDEPITAGGARPDILVLDLGFPEASQI